MFRQIQTYDRLKWEQGKQHMCCVEMQYLQHVHVGEPVVPVKIYVRCFVTKIKSKFDDTYMVTVSDKWLANSEKYCSKMYLAKNLPNLYEMPLLWAQPNRVILFEEDGRVNFLLGQNGKPLEIMDLFSSEECINRKDFQQLCLNCHCETE